MESFLKNSEEVLSVGEFSRRFKMLVKAGVPELWLRGEISNLKTYGSGHTYFTIKDSEAAVSAVLFKGYSKSLAFPLREGMKILAFGEVSVYEARSSYQLIVKAALKDGLGDLARRFEELKQKLSLEGLFDASKKKRIPALPRNIAVVTSPSGAAIRDFCRILKRRGWRGNVWILPSRVQGAGAPAEIVSAISRAQKNVPETSAPFDLIVVMRGGGSLEDLWAFNDESVARALAASLVPVISAVGHEIDFTLSDFAADLRAETPSAAAEYISSSYIELANSLRETSLLLARNVEFLLASKRECLRAAAERLRLNSPQDRIENFRVSLDELSARLGLYAERLLGEKRALLSPLESAFAAASPLPRLNLLRNKIDSLKDKLDILGVENTLRRGYALPTDDCGRILSSISEFKAEMPFWLMLSDGKVKARAIRGANQELDA